MTRKTTSCLIQEPTVSLRYSWPLAATGVTESDTVDCFSTEHETMEATAGRARPCKVL